MRIHLVLLKNWWVLACLLMTGGLYFQALHKKNQFVAKLQAKVDQINVAKEEALLKHEELLLRMESQEDPESMELILKEKLGVVAEGETKVVLP